MDLDLQWNAPPDPQGGLPKLTTKKPDFQPVTAFIPLYSRYLCFMTYFLDKDIPIFHVKIQFLVTANLSRIQIQIHFEKKRWIWFQIHTETIADLQN